MEQGQRGRGWKEGSASQVRQDSRILTTGKQTHGILCLGNRFTKDVNGFRLKIGQRRVEAGGSAHRYGGHGDYHPW